MKIETLTVFTPPECVSLTAEVFKMERFLINRGGFYTLGAATYQDDPLAYPAIANAFNMILEAQFADMYNRVNHILKKHFGQDVLRMELDFALPGFHVFDCQSNGLEGHPHIDEPYTRVNFDLIDWHSPFSFTVPICIPKAGAGMDYWPHHTDADIETFMKTGQLPHPVHLAYTQGKMYIHDGLTPHRIASVAPIPEGEYRITLQGHGVKVNDGIIVYF